MACSHTNCSLSSSMIFRIIFPLREISFLLLILLFCLFFNTCYSCTSLTSASPAHHHHHLRYPFSLEILNLFFLFNSQQPFGLKFEGITIDIASLVGKMFGLSLHKIEPLALFFFLSLSLSHPKNIKKRQTANPLMSSQLTLVSWLTCLLCSHHFSFSASLLLVLLSLESHSLSSWLLSLSVRHQADKKRNQKENNNKDEEEKKEGRIRTRDEFTRFWKTVIESKEKKRESSFRFFFHRIKRHWTYREGWRQIRYYWL